jgi:hypothetical protein
MMPESVFRLDAAFLPKVRRVFGHHFPTTHTGNELNARRPGAVAMHGGALYRDRRHAGGECAQHRFALEPGDHLARAAMNAGTERYIPGEPAGDVELVGPLPAALVTTG